MYQLAQKYGEVTDANVAAILPLSLSLRFVLIETPLAFASPLPCCCLPVPVPRPPSPFLPSFGGLLALISFRLGNRGYYLRRGFIAYTAEGKKGFIL